MITLNVIAFDKDGAMTEIKRITLYKIKAGKDFEDFLRGNLAGYDHIEADGEFEGYIKYVSAGGGEKTDEQIPWLNFLNSGFPGKKYEFQAFNRFPRALMALKVTLPGDAAPVYYAAAFGQHGDSYLDKEQIVYDFGIKVGMNICDIDKLRRIQTSAHEAISRQTERQASTGTSLGVFGINTESEFLRTISGAVKADYAESVESFRGKDNIQIKFPKDKELSWSDLAALCVKLEERYWSGDYTQTELRVYDILRHESDPVVIAALDTTLASLIAEGDFSKIHLAPPEFLTGDDLTFSYRSKEGDELPPTFDDLRITDLVAVPRRRLKNLTANTIKNWPIYQYDPETQQTYYRWDAYRCLVAEVELNEKTYVLSSGQWREVSEELKETVETYFQDHDLALDAEFLPSDVSIYSEDRGENREEVYNVAAAEGSEDLYLMDKAKLEIAGKRIYEVCDLLHKAKHIIHVKRYSSGAASISHLFAQGKFYAHAFSTDNKCRSGMCAWIEGDESDVNATKAKADFRAIIPEKNNDLDEKEYTIVFCVLHDQDEFSIDALPFMSRYELMLSHRFLTEDRRFKAGVAFRKVLLGPQNE